jgi:hypothetical protein
MFSAWSEWIGESRLHCFCHNVGHPKTQGSYTLFELSTGCGNKMQGQSFFWDRCRHQHLNVSTICDIWTNESHVWLPASNRTKAVSNKRYLGWPWSWHVVTQTHPWGSPWVTMGHQAAAWVPAKATHQTGWRHSPSAKHCMQGPQLMVAAFRPGSSLLQLRGTKGIQIENDRITRNYWCVIKEPKPTLLRDVDCVHCYDRCRCVCLVRYLGHGYSLGFDTSTESLDTSGNTTDHQRQPSQKLLNNYLSIYLSIYQSNLI